MLLQWDPGSCSKVKGSCFYHGDQNSQPPSEGSQRVYKICLGDCDSVGGVKALGFLGILGSGAFGNPHNPCLPGRRPEGNEPQMKEACAYDFSILGLKVVNIHESTRHLHPKASKARNIARSNTPCQRLGALPLAVAAGTRGFALPAGVLLFKASSCGV